MKIMREDSKELQEWRKVKLMVRAEAERLIEFIKKRAYPMKYDTYSIEKGMTVTGIAQAIREFYEDFPPEAPKAEKKLPDEKMTKLEAIKILQSHHMWTGEPEELVDVRKENEALNMAIEALSAECENQDKIKVGDEVIDKYGRKGIAVRDEYYIGLDEEPFELIWYGTNMSNTSAANIEKTGRQFPQIREILKQLLEVEE